MPRPILANADTGFRPAFSGQTRTGARKPRPLRVIRPREAIPIHYDDYTLFKPPLFDFRRAAAGAGLLTNLRYLGRGDTARLTRDGTVYASDHHAEG